MLGQVCFGIERLYVPDALLGDVVNDIGRILDDFVVGLGLDPGVRMGPVHSRRQRARVQGFVDQAHARGAVATHAR